MRRAPRMTVAALAALLTAAPVGFTLALSCDVAQAGEPNTVRREQRPSEDPLRFAPPARVTEPTPHGSAPAEAADGPATRRTELFIERFIERRRQLLDPRPPATYEGSAPAVVIARKPARPNFAPNYAPNNSGGEDDVEPGPAPVRKPAMLIPSTTPESITTDAIGEPQPIEEPAKLLPLHPEPQADSKPAPDAAKPVVETTKPAVETAKPVSPPNKVVSEANQLPPVLPTPDLPVGLDHETSPLRLKTATDKPTADKPAADKPASERAESTPALLPADGARVVPKVLNHSQLTVSVQGTRQASLGQPIDYLLIVRNPGTTPARGILLEAHLPTGAELVASDAARGSQLSSWTVDELAPGDTKQFPLKFICRKAGDVAFETRLSVPTIEQHTVHVVEPKLLVEAIQDDCHLQPGVRSRLVFSVRNEGAGDAQEVRFWARLPNVVRGAQGQQASIDLGTLKSGQRKRVEVPVSVLGAGNATTEVIVAAAGGLESHITTNCEILAPKIKLVARGVAVQQVGSIELFAVELQNTGKLPVTGATVIVGLEEGLQLVDAEAGAQIDPSSRLVGWELPTVEPGATQILRWWVVAQKEGAGKQRIFIEAENGVREETEIRTEVKQSTSLVLEVQDVTDPIHVGDEVIYRVKVANRSTKPSEPVLLTAELSDLLRPILLEGQSERTWTGNAVTFAPLGKLDPNSTQWIQIRAAAKAIGQGKVSVQLRAVDQGKQLLEARETTEIVD